MVHNIEKISDDDLLKHLRSVMENLLDISYRIDIAQEEDTFLYGDDIDDDNRDIERLELFEKNHIETANQLRKEVERRGLQELKPRVKEDNYN